MEKKLVSVGILMKTLKRKRKHIEVLDYHCGKRGPLSFSVNVLQKIIVTVVSKEFETVDEIKKFCRESLLEYTEVKEIVERKSVEVAPLGDFIESLKERYQKELEVLMEEYVDKDVREEFENKLLSLTKASLENRI